MSEEKSIAELVSWSVALKRDELDHLFEEAQREFSRVEQQSTTLDSRFIALVGWALVGIGTLLIAGTGAVDGSSSGVASIAVIAGASIVVLAGCYALLPRLRAYGLDLSWYSDWPSATAHQMKADNLAALIYGARLSRDSRRQRVRALQLPCSAYSSSSVRWWHT